MKEVPNRGRLFVAGPPSAPFGDADTVRDLAFDAYCMQHLEPYCRSAW